MPVSKTCITCSKLFSVPPCRESAKYCCQNCMPKDGGSNANWKGGLVFSNCLECGKQTTAKKSHVKRGEGKYCSRKCQGIGTGKIASAKAIKNRFVKNCIVCNSEIRVKQSHSEIEGTYCGKNCMSLDYATRMIGDANPNFQHGNAHVSGFYIKQRKNIDGSYPKEYPSILYSLQRGRCINCKKSLNDKYHIDHIQPVAKGGTNYHWNLQLLCPSCNCRKHAKDPIVWANENGRLL